MKLRFSAISNRRLVLVLILIVAASLRLWNLDWHLPAVLHPDEPNIVNRAMRFGTGDLNPHFFIYGSLLMYLSFLGYGCYFVGGYVLGNFVSVESFATHFFLDPTWFFLIPRLISASAGVATVWLVYLLGRRLYSPPVGLLAATGLALYADHVRESHYALPAVLGAFLVTSVFVAMLRVTEESLSDKSRLIGCGLLSGLAVGAHLLAFIAPVILCLWILQQGHKNVTEALRAISLIAVGGLIGLFSSSPFLFLDYPAAHEQIFGWAETLQTISLGRVSLLSTLVSQVENIGTSFGWVGGGLVIGGCIVAIRRRLPASVVFTVAAVAYLLFTSNQGFAPPRYTLMIVPILCIFFGVGAEWLVSQLYRFQQPCPLWVWAGFLLVITAQSGAEAIREAHLFGKADSRVLAQRWIYENIPPDSRLLLNGPEAGMPKLMENPERLHELELEVKLTGSGPLESFKHLDDYYRYKALAAEKSSEPVYWIIRLKHGWWASAEAEQSLATSYGLVPPGSHVGAQSLDDYRDNIGIEYVVSNSWQLRYYDNSLFPIAQQFYADLREHGRLIHVEEVGPSRTGPEVFVWRIRE